jgi:Cys-rich protein (TIGR01571 family)
MIVQAQPVVAQAVPAGGSSGQYLPVAAPVVATAVGQPIQTQPIQATIVHAVAVPMQQYPVQQQPLPVRQYNGNPVQQTMQLQTGKWSSGICDCCNERNSLGMACCCPCFSYAQIVSNAQLPVIYNKEKKFNTSLLVYLALVIGFRILQNIIDGAVTPAIFGDPTTENQDLGTSTEDQMPSASPIWQGQVVSIITQFILGIIFAYVIYDVRSKFRKAFSIPGEYLDYDYHGGVVELLNHVVCSVGCTPLAHRFVILRIWFSPYVLFSHFLSLLALSRTLHHFHPPPPPLHPRVRLRGLLLRLVLRMLHSVTDGPAACSQYRPVLM